MPQAKWDPEQEAVEGRAGAGLGLLASSAEAPSEHLTARARMQKWARLPRGGNHRWAHTDATCPRIECDTAPGTFLHFSNPGSSGANPKASGTIYTFECKLAEKQRCWCTNKTGSHSQPGSWPSSWAPPEKTGLVTSKSSLFWAWSPPT